MSYLAGRLLLLFVLVAFGGPVSAAMPSPVAIGERAAAAWLERPDFMIYQVGDVSAVHYAEVASAYGATRLARASGNDALLERIAARHGRLIAEAIPNSANHVDANVYGLWPLVLGGSEDRARGLALADGQWQETGPDGLTGQARYWIDDIWMIGLLQVEAWRATGDRRYLDRAALTARLYVARLQQPSGLFHHGPTRPSSGGAAMAGSRPVLPRSCPNCPAIIPIGRRSPPHSGG